MTAKTMLYYRVEIQEGFYPTAQIRFYEKAADDTEPYFGEGDFEFHFQGRTIEADDTRPTVATVNTEARNVAYWFTTRIEMPMHYTFDIPNKAKTLRKTLEKIEATIEKFNIHYRYENDRLAQMVAALKKMGAQEVSYEKRGASYEVMVFDKVSYKFDA